jgi:uncharacterized OB-fold protein
VPLDLEVIASSSDRPLPTPDAFSGPFWAAARQHELVVQRCDDCGRFRFYPRPMCPDCHSMRAQWTRCSGRGMVYSFTVVRRPLARWFASRVPLVCAVIELEEGVRMMSNVIGIDPDQVRIGLEVTVSFEDIDEQISLPVFEAVPGDDAATG